MKTNKTSLGAKCSLWDRGDAVYFRDSKYNPSIRNHGSSSTDVRILRHVKYTVYDPASLVKLSYKG